MPDEPHHSDAADPAVSDDWDRTRCWVESETGMDLSGSRLPRLREAVGKCFPGQEVDSVLRRMLAHAGQQAEFLERLTGQLTVGESFFFRNEHHFQTLRDIVLPQILTENASRREVRLWSAGCATGEEPYSLAILLQQLVGDAPGWRVSVLGTDLNAEFLRRARESRYRPWSFRQTDIHHDRTYFTRDGETFRLSEEVRKQVRFAYLNLVKDAYPSPLTGTVGLDLILFRNVAIYLKADVIAAILQRFFQALRPGGWLLLGETEVAAAPPGDFEVRRIEQSTLYQKPLGGRSANPSDASASLPPAAVSGGLSASSRVPMVPTLPDWVPLPRRRASSRDESPMASPAMALDRLTWEHIERAVAAGRLDEVELHVSRVADVKQRASMRLRLVRVLLSQSELARARRMLDVCLTEDPLLLEAQLLKAGFAEESGDLQAAEKACRRALYISPKAPMAHFQLALVLEQKGDGQGVARCLKSTLDLIKNQDPHAPVEFGDGACYGRLKEMVLLFMAKSSG